MRESLGVMRKGMRSVAKEPERWPGFTELCTDLLQTMKSTGRCH
jgi:hypothetical protein